MGMFDYIEHEANCESCGEPLSGFQSKDNVCELKTLKPSDVDVFYTSCDKCNAWHNFYVKRECIVKEIKAVAEDE